MARREESPEWSLKLRNGKVFNFVGRKAKKASGVKTKKDLSGRVSSDDLSKATREEKRQKQSKRRMGRTPWQKGGSENS